MVRTRLLTLHLFDRLPWPSQKLDRLELPLIKTRPILLRCAEHLWCERSRWARRCSRGRTVLKKDHSTRRRRASSQNASRSDLPTSIPLLLHTFIISRRDLMCHASLDDLPAYLSLSSMPSNLPSIVPAFLRACLPVFLDNDMLSFNFVLCSWSGL